VNIIPIYDTSDQSFINDIQAAINIFDSTFTNDITVVINIGYGDFDGTTLPDTNLALGTVTSAVTLSYSTLRTDLEISSTPNFFTDATLPATSSINGVSSFLIGPAQERLFGILPATAGPGDVDGLIGIGTGIPAGNQRISVALHEIGHALGRLPGSALDLFRFTSPGNRLFGDATPAPAAYFSLDGGVTVIANWGQSSDPSDFLNNGLTPNDPFDEFTGTLASLTTKDIQVTEALGWSLPPSPPAAGTTADMILRRADGNYEIYNIGNNAILGANALGQVGPDYQFAGLGNFNRSNTTDMLLRSSAGAFEIYNIANSRIAAATALGQVGLDFQVAGFGKFNGPGTTDMMMRNTNTGLFELYDINNNMVAGANAIGQVGLEWQIAGFGDFNGDGTSDMLLRDTLNGAFEVYDINKSLLTSASSMGTVGNDWQVAGFGDFNGDRTSDMMLRNVSTGTFELYDIDKNMVISANAIGQVGLEWQVAGFGPIEGIGTSDMVLRNILDGSFEVYDIVHSQLVSAANLGQVGLDFQLGGLIAVDIPAHAGIAGSVAQLVQAMAGFATSASTSSSADLLTYEAHTQFAGVFPNSSLLPDTR
jgi:hypothetical protein